MAKCNKCGGNRIISNGCKTSQNGCFDVCTTPICADPSVLSIYAPLIYDEIGINLCTTFDLGTDISTAYPTAVSACAQIIDIAYTYGEGNVEIEAIAGRPNCYLVTLSNLTVTFAVNVYDASCRLLGTLYPTAVYLPSDTGAATYDEDTNPSTATLEVFAPYGVSYNSPGGGGAPTVALNYIGFLSTDNYVRQGINMYAIPKVLNFDIDDDTITVGITLIVQSLYFAGYKVASGGKINTPKGSLIPAEDNECLYFVAGDLLNLAIKPLDLGTPCCEENLKQDCEEDPSCCGCGGGATDTTSAPAAPAPLPAQETPAQAPAQQA